jgi:hypothetical protein
MALAVSAAGEWVEDIKAFIIDDEWFGPIANYFADPSLRPPPSITSTKERKVWVSAQQFYLEEKGLLWLPRDLEKTQVNKITWAKNNVAAKGVELTMREKEMEADGKADIRGQLGIPKMMQ